MGLLKKKRYSQPVHALQSKNRNGLPTAPGSIDQSMVEAKNFATQAALAMFQKPDLHDSQGCENTVIKDVQLPRRSSFTSLASSSTVGTSTSKPTTKPSTKRQSSHITKSISTNSNLSALQGRSSSNTGVGNNRKTSQTSETKPSTSSKNKRYSAIEPAMIPPQLANDLHRYDFRSSSPAISIDSPDKRGNGGLSLAASAASLAVKSSNSKLHNGSQDDFLGVSPFTKPVIPGIHNGSKSTPTSDDFFAGATGSTLPHSSSFSSMNSYASSNRGNSSESSTKPPLSSQRKSQQPHRRSHSQMHESINSSPLRATKDRSEHQKIQSNEDNDDQRYSEHFPGTFDGFDNHYYFYGPSLGGYSGSRSNSNTTRSDSNHRQDSNISEDFHEMHMNLSSKLGWNNSDNSLEDIGSSDLMIPLDSTKHEDDGPHRSTSPPHSILSIPTIKAPPLRIPTFEHQALTPVLSEYPSSPFSESNEVLNSPVIPNDATLKGHNESANVNAGSHTFHYPLPKMSTFANDRVLDSESPELAAESPSSVEFPKSALQSAIQLRSNPGKIPLRKPPSSSLAPGVMNGPASHIQSSIDTGGESSTSTNSKSTASSNGLYELGSSIKRSISPRRKPPPMSPTQAPDITSSYPPTSSELSAILGSDIDDHHSVANSSAFETDDSYFPSEYESDQDQIDALPQYPSLHKPKTRHLSSSGHRVHPSFSTSRKIKAITDPEYISSHGFKRNAKNIIKKGLMSAGYNAPASSSHHHHHHSRHSESSISSQLDSSNYHDPMTKHETSVSTPPLEDSDAMKVPTMQFKTTMRKAKKCDKINESKPWKQHNDRHYITEQEKKRYLGLWASNKGSYFQYLHEDVLEKLRKEKNETVNPALAASKSSAAAQVKAGNNDQTTVEHDIPNVNLILNIVVRDLWHRSKLPSDLLSQIYELVDYRRDGFLEKKSFIVGMWLVDQCLYGRKLPKVITEELWGSATMNVNVLITGKKGHKSKK